MINLLPSSFWLQHQAKIEQWITEQYAHFQPPIYCSIDIRNAGFKAAHVDANLFPAGFNNIHPSKVESVSHSFDSHITNHFPAAKNILLIAEDFTRNKHYLQNISMLSKLLSTGNRECRTSFITDLTNKSGTLYANEWRPDLIVLNTDLSLGIPPILQGISQDITPSPALGWHARSKYRHFIAFQKIIGKFAQHFGIDEWLLSTHCQISSDIDFRQKTGLDDLASKVDEVLSLTRDKYQEYNIAEQPYVFIKADNGTFGAGIMTANSGEDIININKKTRHSMQTINHGIVNSAVLIQEGVPTSLTTEGAAEYVYYLIGGKAEFRILRRNNLKDKFGNLNSKGMELIADPDIPYGVEYLLARLATLATLFEL